MIGMDSPSKAGGQKWATDWVHLPLADGRGRCCLELPGPYARSARILLLLTTEHPRLLRVPAWRDRLTWLLDGEVDAALADKDRPRKLARLVRLLERHAQGALRAGPGRQILSQLLAAWLDRIPPELKGALDEALVPERGRRHEADTLMDHDQVEIRCLGT
jgi:hypothetical protein